MDRLKPVPQKIFRKICRDMETVEQREAKEGDKTMEDRYEVSIPISEYVNDAASPRIYFDSYKEAVSYAKPLIEQGYDVVIGYEEDEEDEFIRIPLDTYQYIEKLTNEQTGSVFKNINMFFFDGVEPESEDGVVRIVTMQMIKRIRECTQNGK